MSWTATPSTRRRTRPGSTRRRWFAPTGNEIDEFRAGLEAHWGGNLPALWAYLNSIDPAGGDNPEPPGEGAAPYWEPDDDYDDFGNVIETAEEERDRWRARVEQKLRQLSQSY